MRTIEACLSSLLELRYPKGLLDVCVVDNASSDRTARALQHFRDAVTVLHEPRRGPGAARNAGLRYASGQVVAFTDADCVLEPDWLGGLVAALEDPSVGIAGGEIRAIDRSNPVQRFGEEVHDHRRAIEEFDPPYAITMSWASRRSVLQELGGFDEAFLRGEDVDLSYRLLQAGYRIAFVPGSIVLHQNEATLLGLWREGFQHGLYGVAVMARHAEFLRRLGHRRVNLGAYRPIGAGARAWMRGRADDRTRCETVFNAGKRAGKVLGSARFRHLDI